MSNKFLATETRNRIEKAAKSPTHAFLISGPPASFRQDALNYLEQLLQCTAGNGCGICAQCKRLASENNPNTFSITPEGASIKIEQIRDLINRIQYGAPEGEYYTIKLYDAHQMTTQAANALLRTLESPPSGVIFLLGAPSKATLLPTIISRCQVITCVTTEEKKIHSFLEAAQFDSINDWLSAPNTAIQMSMSETKQSIQIPSIQDIANLSMSQRIIKTHAIGKSKEWVQLAFIKWAEELWREIQKKPNLSANHHAFKLLDLLVENILQIRYNLNPRLLLDRFLLSI